MGTNFSWEVYQPQKRRSYIGAPLPTGSVHVVNMDGSSEFIDVPSYVSRALARAKTKGDTDPQTRDELIECIASASLNAAWSRLLKLFERRDYSELEVAKRLAGEGFDERVVRKTLSRGIECGLISNDRFMDAFIRGKIGAGWGLLRIERELAKRGIDASTIDGWPYEFIDPEDELARATNIASRKSVREPNRQAKLIRFLMNRGFSYGVSSKAAKNVLTQ